MKICVCEDFSVQAAGGWIWDRQMPSLCYHCGAIVDLAHQQGCGRAEGRGQPILGICWLASKPGLLALATRQPGFHTTSSREGLHHMLQRVDAILPVTTWILWEIWASYWELFMLLD